MFVFFAKKLSEKQVALEDSRILGVGEDNQKTNSGKWIAVIVIIIALAGAALFFAFNPNNFASLPFSSEQASTVSSGSNSDDLLVESIPNNAANNSNGSNNSNVSNSNNSSAISDSNTVSATGIGAKRFDSEQVIEFSAELIPSSSFSFQFNSINLSLDGAITIDEGFGRESKFEKSNWDFSNFSGKISESSGLIELRGTIDSASSQFSPSQKFAKDSITRITLTNGEIVIPKATISVFEGSVSGRISFDDGNLSIQNEVLSLKNFNGNVKIGSGKKLFLEGLIVSIKTKTKNGKKISIE